MSKDALHDKKGHTVQIHLLLSLAAIAVPWIVRAESRDPSAFDAFQPPPPSLQTGGSPPAPAKSEGNKKLRARKEFKDSFYGTIGLGAFYDSTQSFQQAAKTGGLIAPPGTHEGDNSQFGFDLRRSRFGYRMRSAESNGITASGVLEFYLENAFLLTEGRTFRTPLVGIRRAMLTLNTPYVDISAGMDWSLFGFFPHYMAPSFSFGNIPGEPPNTLQFRVSRLFKMSKAIHLEVAAAAHTNPKQETELPQAVAGVRLFSPDWKGAHAKSNLRFDLEAPASLAVSGLVRQVKNGINLEGKSEEKIQESYALAINLLIPILSIRQGKKLSNACTLTGTAIFKTDNELGALLRPNSPTVIPSQSYRVSLEYYLPPSGNMWISGNLQRLESPHMDAFVPEKNGKKEGAIKQEAWAEINARTDVKDVRIGLQYALFHQHQIDRNIPPATNHRVMLSGFYSF